MSDHRELIEEAREIHQAGSYGCCLGCPDYGGPVRSPCITARLAAALEEQEAEAAALRAAIERNCFAEPEQHLSVQYPARCLVCRWPATPLAVIQRGHGSQHNPYGPCWVEAALASGAGAALLARLGAAERERDDAIRNRDAAWELRDVAKNAALHLDCELGAARAHIERLAGWAKERGHYPHCPNFQYRPGARPCDARTCGLTAALADGRPEETP